MIDFKTTYANMTEFLLQYNNPFYLVTKSLPLGKFSHKNWIHQGEWLKYKKD